MSEEQEKIKLLMKGIDEIGTMKSKLKLLMKGIDEIGTMTSKLDIKLNLPDIKLDLPGIKFDLPDIKFDLPPNFFQLWENSLNKMTDAGWTIPMDFTPAETVKIISTVKSGNEIDKFFVNYYTKNNNKNLKILRDKLKRSSDLTEWNLLLNECFEIFFSGFYRATIPCLLSILEGVIAKKFGLLRNKTIGKGIRNKIKVELKNLSKGSMKYLIHKSIKDYFDELWNNIDFSKNRPICLNRNWVLHGRDTPAKWRTSDSLKLFHTFQTITSLKIKIPVHLVKNKKV